MVDAVPNVNITIDELNSTLQMRLEIQQWQTYAVELNTVFCWSTIPVSFSALCVLLHFTRLKESQLRFYWRLICALAIIFLSNAMLFAYIFTEQSIDYWYIQFKD